MPQVLYANVYETARLYGGPEEGGWYYDVGEPIMSLPFVVNEKSQDEGYECDNLARNLAIEQVYDLCVVAGIPMPEKEWFKRRDWTVDEFMICIEKKPGEHFPKKRPHWDMGEDY